MAVAIITGASRGLGRALARSLAERSWRLVLDARGGDELQRVADDLQRLTAVEAVVGDIADPAHREQLAEAADRLGPLELIVNNASTLGPSPLPHLGDYPLDQLGSVLRTNVIGPLGLIQRTLPALRRNRGAIVNVTSDAAVEGYEGWGGYGASKAALEQITNVLAAEEPEVRVYRFDPGDMRTQMHQEAFPGDDISDRPEPESVVPALLRLLEERPNSGRYQAGELLKEALR